MQDGTAPYRAGKQASDSKSDSGRGSVKTGVSRTVPFGAPGNRFLPLLTGFGYASLTA